MSVLLVVLFLAVLSLAVVVYRQYKRLRSFGGEAAVKDEAAGHADSDGDPGGDVWVTVLPGDEDGRDDELHDRLLFERVHRLIVDGKLFLDPGFSRETYIKLSLVNKNKVGQLVQRYAGTNLNGYINDMRLEYAVGLLHEKPDMPIKALVVDSGFSSVRTFYRLFTAKYGVTPTQYRDNL